MKLLRLILLVTLASSAAARADLTIVQKVQNDSDTSNVTLKIKGEKARVEVNPQITTILDAKTGDLITLMNDQKKIMRISGERAKAMAEMANSIAKQNGAESVPQPTGKKETINGYETEEYVSDSPHLHMSYWVARNYPRYQEIMQQLQVLQKGAFAAIRRGMPDYSKLPGLPIRTEIKSDGKNAITSTLVSVNFDPVPDSTFDIPPDYTEVKMPDFLNGKPSPGQADHGGNQ